MLDPVLIDLDKYDIIFISLTIILICIITNQVYESVVAYLVYTILNRFHSNKNKIILKFDKINISLLCFCLYIKNFKLIIKNIGYFEINEVIIKINLFGNKYYSLDQHSESIFYIRFDCTNVFIYDESFGNHKNLVTLLTFLLNNSVFDVWYANICICYNKHLHLCSTFSIKQFLFIYENNEFSHFRFQVYNLNVYLNNDKLIKHDEKKWFFKIFKQKSKDNLNKSYLLMSASDMNGDLHFKFKNSILYRAKFLKISAQSNEILFEDIGFYISLKTKLNFELNIDLWDSRLLALPVLIKSIENFCFDNKEFENSTIIFHLDMLNFNINIVNSTSKLFKLHFSSFSKKNVKLELIESYKRNEKRKTRVNFQTNLLKIYSLLNKRPIFSTKKELSLFLDYKSQKLTFNLKINKVQNVDETTLINLYNLHENYNLFELCLMKFKEVKIILAHSFNDDCITSINFVCLSDEFITKLILNRKNDIIIISVNSFSLNSKFSSNKEEKAAGTITLFIFNDVTLKKPTIEFDIKFERLVVETTIESTEVKIQYIFTPLILQSIHESQSLNEAIYLSVIQIRNHLFYNVDICYSNQIEIIIGDIFGTFNYVDLLKVLEFFNLLTSYVFQEIYEKTPIYMLIFKDVEIINSKKYVYKSYRLHSSIVHVNILHKDLMLEAGVNIIMSPICFAYCDLHCKNGQSGYLGYITDVHLRFFSSNSINWIEHGFCVYNYLSIYKCYDMDEEHALQINFLIKNDQNTKRLEVFWDEESISQMIIINASNQILNNNFKFASCACTGSAKFFSNSLDRKKFYFTENHFKLKPCIYRKTLENETTSTFGQSILTPANVYALNSYLHFKHFKNHDSKLRAPCKIINTVSFDEGNHFIREKGMRRIKNELPIEDIILTPTADNKILKEFSLYIEYLPMIKNISNIIYDPQDPHNYIVPNSISKYFFENLRSYTHSSSLRELKNFKLHFCWLYDKNFFKESNSSESSNSDSSTNISFPVSLNPISIDSLLSNVTKDPTSDFTSLRSYITPIFESSFDMSSEFSEFKFKKQKKRLPVSELVLKVANHSRSVDKYKNKMKINVNIKNNKKQKNKIKLNLNINNNHNNSNDNEKEKHPKLRFNVNQKYPLLNFDKIYNKEISFEEEVHHDVTLSTFEYIKNDQYLKVPSQNHNKEDDLYLKLLNECCSFDNLSKSIEFHILHSNHLFTPHGLEIADDLLKLKKIDLNYKFNSILFDKMFYNIIWTTGDSKTHNYQIKLEKIQFLKQKQINIDQLIVNLKNLNEINIKNTIKQVATILLKSSFNGTKFSFSDILINKMNIINRSSTAIDLPGFTISNSSKQGLIDFKFKLNNWTIKQSLPVNYMTNILTIFYNLNRYFNILKPSVYMLKYKFTLIITNLNFKLFKNLDESNKYVSIKFSTKSLKLCTSNSFEIKNLLFRLLTTLQIDFELYSTNEIDASSNTLRIKTTGSDVTSNDSTFDLISVDDDRMMKMIKSIKFQVIFEKRVLDSSFKISIKSIDLTREEDFTDDLDFDYYITVIFPLVIESKLVYSNENELKLSLPGILSYVSSKNEIMHVFELIDTIFYCNDLERKIKFIINKSRIMNSKNITSIIEYFKVNFLNYFEYNNNNNNNYELNSYKIEIVYGELKYTYFLTDQEWLYFKLNEFEIEWSRGKCLKLKIEYCKNLIREKQREIELLAISTNKNNNKSVKKINEKRISFELKNSCLLYVTSKLRNLPIEKFNFNKWLSYACIDNEHNNEYSIKVVALFPTLDLAYKLVNINKEPKISEWDLEAFFEQNMFIDTKLTQELWDKFVKIDNYRNLIKSEKMLKIHLNNFNLVDYLNGKKLYHTEEFLNEFFKNNPNFPFFLHFCSIEPFNIFNKFIDLFK